MTRKAIAFCLLVFISTCAGLYQSQGNVQTILTPTMEGEAWCEMCVIFMERVDVLIKEKMADGKVDETLHELCDAVNGMMRQECYAMLPMIERQIAHGIKPKSACETMQLCGGIAPALITKFVSKIHSGDEHIWEHAGNLMRSASPHMETSFKQFHNFSAKTGSSVSCFLCKTITGMIDKSLMKYKKPLVEAVVEICNDLPAPTNKACSNAMKYYIPHWWDQFFTTIASANNVCEALHLCDEP